MNLSCFKNFKVSITTSVFILVLMLFFAGFFILQNINGRFWLHDFEVYYSASNALADGGQVYGKAFGLDSGYYKYSPIVLYLFLPLAVFPFGIAKVIYFVLLCLSILIAIRFISAFIRDVFFPDTFEMIQLKVQLLMFLVCLLPFYYELHLGNINSLLLLLVVPALVLHQQGKVIPAATLLALAVLVKPHFLLFFPLLVFRKEFKFIGISVIVLLFGLLSPSVYTGLATNYQLHQDWLTTMMIHNQSPVTGFDTIYSWIYRIIDNIISFQPGIWFSFTILGIFYMLLFRFVHRNMEREQAGHENCSRQRNFVFEYFWVLAVIPNLTVTDFEHFMFSLPLISLLFFYLLSQKPPVWITMLSVIAFVLYGGNIRDMVGKTISAWMTTNGILGLGNMMIVILALIVWRKVRQNPSQLVSKVIG